jgi:hypothetical protein
MRNIGKSAFVLASVLFGSSVVSAETLTVSGWYAAEERDASMLRTVAVDRFDGNDGPALVAEIERRLRAARDRDGAPYFELRSRYAKVDAFIHGDVRTRTENVNFTRKAKRCANNIYSTKCKDEEKVQVDLYCVRRVITVAANVQITRLSDDARIYSRVLPQRNESESCEGEKPASDIGNVVGTLVRKAADEFASQITPYGRTEKIRIRESRNGLSKEDGNQMKALIAATKTSEPAACAGWREMEQRGVAHATLKFNLGLCAEAAGQLDMALGYYRPLEGRGLASADVTEAINRVERRIAGEVDDRARKETTATPKPKP